MTERELVYATLEFRNKEGRAPRQLWSLPCAHWNHQDTIDRINRDYPEDIAGPPVILRKPTIEQGNPYVEGTYIDAWGCRFTNIHPGVHGEVKESLILDDDWSNADQIHVPTELLDFDVDAVNRFCASTDKFVSSGCNPRPFEQLQFIRTSELLFMDLMDMPTGMTRFMQKMHTFYCDWVEKWAKTDVDCVNMMDDWGSQQSLLINPMMWREMFKPMYKDYVEIAKRYGKKAFMHSDGYTLDIIPELIDIGMDAVNCQMFCIGVDKLAPYKGKITFWGEIDRQHLLVTGETAEVERAVKSVYDTLWADGGCIAQCEFGPGAKPENVYTVFKAWDKVSTV